MKALSEKNQTLRETFYKSLIELSCKEGILASGREEAYGCIFGRDSAITVLEILEVYTLNPSLELF